MNNKSYEIIKVNMTWTAAAACAVQRGGKLAEVMSKQENDSLFHYAKNKAGINTASTTAPDGGSASYIWIGGNDIQTEGKWIWDGDGNLSGIQFWQGNYLSGNPVNGLFNAWGSVNGGEPDDAGNQDGLGLALTSWPYGNAGEWNDISTNNSLYFIVELSGTTGLNKSVKSYSKYPVHLENNNIIINQASDIKFVEIYGIDGKLIYHTENELNQGKIFIPAENLEQGILLIKIIDNNGNFSFNKISII
ncbi:MAG: T9SS type A sorting domain-containing protein [Bacteroidia bacterium]|nr:T9SS type A sorting domain-containing protein [Bacteroidia bacterium]